LTDNDCSDHPTNAVEVLDPSLLTTAVSSASHFEVNGYSVHGVYYLGNLAFNLTNGTVMNVSDVRTLAVDQVYNNTQLYDV